MRTQMRIDCQKENNICELCINTVWCYKCTFDLSNKDHEFSFRQFIIVVCANQIKYTLSRSHTHIRSHRLFLHASRINFDVSGAQLVFFIHVLFHFFLWYQEGKEKKELKKITNTQACVYVFVFLNKIYLILLSIAPHLSICSWTVDDQTKNFILKQNNGNSNNEEKKYRSRSCYLKFLNLTLSHWMLWKK